MKRMGELNWNDLRFLLALERAGTLLGAARLVRVAHSTVARRLEAAERALQVPLFHRRGSQLVATEAAASILAHAHRIEAEFASLSRAAFGTEGRMAGQVRLAAPLALITDFLMQRLPPFQQAYPLIGLSLMGDLPLERMLRGDADIALRISKPVSDQLDIRRIAHFRFGLYAAPPLARKALSGLGGDLPFLSVTEEHAGLPEIQWIHGLFPGRAPTLRLSTTLALRSAAVAGMGITALPRYLGDATASLSEITPPSPSPAESLFLVTHREQRGLARIRALVEYLSQVVGSDRALFGGRFKGAAGCGELC
jgi:DNA-binding transcriptional LysR family regulator